jgi:hypothetical protein
MTKTAKQNKQKNNYTQKNKKNKKCKINNIKYKSCKEKMYKSIYGGRYMTNMFI